MDPGVLGDMKFITTTDRVKLPADPDPHGPCPGCGRCRECGQPYPAAYPYVAPYPYAPYPYGDPRPLPGDITIVSTTATMAFD